ncbi:MAG: hypothetical protein KKB59_10510 [Spirochaetes bacterium]|nr:hypothetical protein [Spirochaetota bacterium]
MAQDIVGTPNKVGIGGFQYRVAADADFKHGKPAYKNEGEETTGGTFRKMTKQSQEVESVTLKVNADELERLKEAAESKKPLNLSYETVEGSVYRGQGFIDYDGRQTASGKVEVKMFPQNGWTSFTAK